MKSNEVKNWIRKCKCGKEIIYKHRMYYLKAERQKTLCRYCGNVMRGTLHTDESRLKISKGLTGRKLSDTHREKISERVKGNGNPFKGKSHNEETKKAHSERMKGNDYGKYRKITLELCEKISKSRIGIIPWNKGKIGVQTAWNKGTTGLFKTGLTGDKNPTKRPEVRQKLRLAYIEQIKKLKGNYKVMYNPFACKVIDKYGTKYGYNFQHGENAGEFYIPELGYTVDGYDVDRNTVIEYYENSFKHRTREERDARREKEIREFLNCEFIVIREWDENDKRLINELVNGLPKNT